MNTAYIVDILRTPVGKFAGTLSSVRPDDMAALVMKEIIARNPNLDPALIEDVVMGAANQAGEDNRNVARMALLLAGLPMEIGGVTVNRLCASGLQAIMDASRAITCGDGEVYLAGGVESMTRAPFVMAKAETAFSRTPEIYDTTIGWRFTNPALSKLHYPFGMGETAENVAERYGISRETQDEFAHQSQVKYKAAAEAGKFRDEIVPVHIPQRKGDDIVFDTDEHPRLSSIEKLGELKPAFKKGGSVTAGNSSGINDGAAVSIIVSEEILKRYNLTPMARVVSTAIAGVDPAHMGMGPVPATQKALKRAGISINDIGLAEINEAFAAQAIPCVQQLDINPDIVNVNGGSIAIGHPLGASGTRISATLLHEMKRRSDVKYGLATMCVGVGQGAAIIYEKV
ncbi:acetyl-CoA C-acetyltransferase [Pontibacter aydingkolensis]|uniref:acetyl-CoA C-acyltransferase n=1 Tax=Pontibacter aydingkolensis TaxID=1911536 RepID=A0ABS7CQQ5_9BACT|nr:acetyl-CoA C-acyltransferase [Pontibacter aydingkolensis]MBW7466173.1 acetyl-CoA C-acyltransferase [Pontibacter aydingkolensis]